MKKYVLALTLLSSIISAWGNKCPRPESIQHGTYEKVEYSGWPGYICHVMYSCDAGYLMNGTRHIYCYQETWIGSAPFCQAVSCPALDAPDNGTMSYIDNGAPNNQLDSIMEFSCDEGYELVGMMSLVCLQNQNWSAQRPNCVSTDCDDFTDKADETTTAVPATTAAPMTTAAVETTGPTPITCDVPTIFAATTDCTASAAFGSTCDVTCNAGYLISGSAVITCGDDNNDGTGDYANQPTCEITTCASPIDVTGSTFNCSGDVNYGGTCELTCAAGYIGARTLTCDQHTAGDATSTWDDTSACSIAKPCNGVRHGGSCFIYVPSPVYFSQVGGKCQELGNGARPATIRTPEALQAVQSYLRRIMPGSFVHTWLGGTYDPRSHPGRTVNWVDGSSTTIATSMWHPGWPGSVLDHTAMDLLTRRNTEALDQGILNTYPIWNGAYPLCEVE